MLPPNLLQLGRVEMSSHRHLARRIAGPLAAFLVLALALVPRGAGARHFDETTAFASYRVGRVNISDSMHRVVGTGFGRANTGGAYSTAPARLFSVGHGVGTIRGVRRGHPARAVLSGTSILNERVKVSFGVASLPRRGNSWVVALDLRRQANGDTYRLR